MMLLTHSISTCLFILSLLIVPRLHVTVGDTADQHGRLRSLSNTRVPQGAFILDCPPEADPVSLFSVGKTKYNGGADYEEWMEGPAPSDKLGMQSFQFRFADGAHKLCHIGLEYNQMGASSQFHDDSPALDDYLWATRAVVLPSGTTMLQVSGRTTGNPCYRTMYSDARYNPSNGVPVLSGFSLEWRRNEEKLLNRIRFQLEKENKQTYVNICFADEAIHQDIEWRADIAFVPAEKVYDFGATPTKAVDPYYPGLDYQYHIGVLPAGTHQVLTGFDIIGVEFEHTSDQFASLLGMDVSDTGMIQVQFLGDEERGHHQFWWKAGWAIIQED